MAEKTEPHVVIVGAGFGGQGVCHGLQGRGKRVTVIDSHDAVSIGASWHYQLADRGEPSSTDLSATIAGKVGSLLSNTTVTQLDTTARCLTLNDGTTLSYDYLVLSPGVDSDPSSVPGLADCALDITDESSFPQIKERVQQMQTGSVLIAIAKCPYSCPPFPFELAFQIDEILRTAGVRDSCQIVITSPVPWPFGGPKAESLFKAAMKAKGIDYRGSITLQSMRKVEDGMIVASYKDDVPDLTADIVLATYPHKAPAFMREHVNPAGFAPVDLQTNRMGKGVADGERRVFCVGDACHAVMPAVGKPMPKAGEFAWQGGVAVGELIGALLSGGEEVLPQSRVARCIVDAGYGNGIVVEPDFSAAVVNPAEGMPKMNVVSLEGGHTQKIDFINQYVSLFTGGEVEKGFGVAPEPNEGKDPTWAEWRQ